MRKVINSKKYDTDTAELIGSWHNNFEIRDFSHCSESLYRKKTGEYFIHGEGGPSSKYAENIGQNEWSGGEKIMPVGYAEAKKWAEENLDADEYEAEFGEVAEDDSKVAVSLSISSSVYESVKREAAKLGVTISSYVESKLSEQ